eukprot:956548_1
MATFTVMEPTDNYLYYNFFNKPSACIRYLYAFNHITKPQCPTHNIACIFKHITTEGQRKRFDRGNKEYDIFWTCPQCCYSVAVTHNSYLSGLKKLTLFNYIKLMWHFYHRRTSQEAAKSEC